MLVTLAAILVALILHRAHLRLMHWYQRSNVKGYPSREGEILTSHSEPPPLADYNDVLSFPESVQENSLQNGRVEDIDTSICIVHFMVAVLATL